MEFRVGAVAEFPVQQWRIMEVSGRSVGIFNAGDRLLAVLNYCPHQGAEVCRGWVSGTMLPSNPGEYVYGMDNRILHCARHGWEFHLETGENAFRKGGGRLLTFPVRVRDGTLFLEMKPVQAKNE